jgi:hypothetical protein
MQYNMQARYTPLLLFFNSSIKSNSRDLPQIRQLLNDLKTNYDIKHTTEGIRKVKLEYTIQEN